MSEPERRGTRAAPGGRGAWAFAGAVVLVLAVWNNLVVTRVPAPYVLVNLAATGLLLSAARACGLSWEDLGLARRHLSAGFRWGATLVLLVVAAYALALAVPALRPLLADERAAGSDAGEVAVRVLVRIPLGTVLWEEIAFRGVLFAALVRVLSVRAAAVVGAAVFGLWHVRPTLDGLEANDLADGAGGRTLLVLLVCLGTAAAGLLFTWLRVRTGSVLAPALLHLATNTVGVLAAAAAHRLG
jgi:uncharacterized protein